MQITVTVDGGKSDVIYRAILDYKDEVGFNALFRMSFFFTECDL